MTTWTTAPILAYRLAVGDRIAFESVADVTLETVEDWDGRSIVLGPIQGWIDDWTVQVYYREPIIVHVPDQPVDGYDLFRPPPGFWPLGCTCVHRRSGDGNWASVALDPECRGCRGDLEEEW